MKSQVIYLKEEELADIIGGGYQARLEVNPFQLIVADVKNLISDILALFKGKKALSTAAT